MRIASLFLVLAFASFASATHPVQIRAVVVQRQYAAPVQALAVEDCYPAQAFAVQQFYQPLQFYRVQAVQSYGHVQQVQQFRVQRAQQVQHVQQVRQVQVLQVRQPVQVQRSVTRTRTVVR